MLLANGSLRRYSKSSQLTCQCGLYPKISISKKHLATVEELWEYGVDEVTNKDLDMGGDML